MPHHFAIIPRVLAGFLLCLLLGSTAGAATFTVSNLLDDGSVGSLRWAIDEANTTAGNDTIAFTVSGTITLTSTLPTITDPDGLTLDGTGQTITVSGNNSVRVMAVNSGASLTVEHLTVVNGRADFGGGILNQGGALSVNNSTFSGNSASFLGGGIYNTSTGTLSIVNSTFSGNSASFNGGGIYNSDSTLSIVNSTFSGNSGGGIHNNDGTLNLSNTILANSLGDDCINSGGTVNASGVNLVETDNCAIPGVLTADPQLGPLADNGGPTQTMALLAGSPAIDAADSGICAASPVNNLDQRGVTRPVGSSCDIGAYEYEGGTITTATTIPTLSEWALMLLSGLVGVLVWWRWPSKRPV